MPTSPLVKATLAPAVCAAALAFLLPVAAQVVQEPVTQRMQLVSPVRPVKRPVSVYIVKLKAPGAASYKSTFGENGAAAPGGGQRMRAQAAASAAASYARQIEQVHDQLLGTVGAFSTKIYSYRYALNGFAARLTPAQVARLAQNDAVERIWPDSDQHPVTNNSAIFLGLENQVGGLRADKKLRGDGVVIGVIDSGVAPNHPSLLDTEERVPGLCRSNWAKSTWIGLLLCGSYIRNPPTAVVFDPPQRFRGGCDVGPGWDAKACNNKVVGARFYIDGYLSRWQLDPGEVRSPKDVDGHGTHVATIAAGNPVDASLLGTRLARVSGIAPRAQLAVYKACWLQPGATRSTCATSDLTRAIDDAVADGVDLINYSVGSLETDITTPDDMALLHALDAGVLTVVAGGNDGPDLYTIGSPSSDPWVLTTAASTQSGELFDDAIEITAPTDVAAKILMREASFTPALTRDKPVEAPLVTADDGQGQIQNGATGSIRDACQALANGKAMKGNIALVERGGCEFDVKVSNAEAAGAVGVVVYSNNGGPIVMNGTTGNVHIPAVMIGNADGQKLVDRLAADAKKNLKAADRVTVKLAAGIFGTLSGTGNIVADFSSRGPSLADANFSKPDVTAPGVDILAGQTPAVANGLRGETFQYMSGTSQSAPETTGVAALLKEAHPDWTPGMLKSALMTTAYQGVTREDTTTADPFDIGAGHIDPNRAIAPGLVYQTDYRDHAAYLCGYHKPPFTLSECAALAAQGYSSSATDLNLPSIGLGQMITGDTIKRRVTNIGPPATFTADVTPPPNVDVLVEPSSLTLTTGQSADFTVRFTDRGTDLDAWNFGRLTWLDGGTQRVTSPISVQAVTLRAPAEIYLSGTSGSAKMPVAFGVNGAYTAAVHGLRKPFLDANGQVPRGFVDNDPNNSFSFRFNNGVAAHQLTVPPGQLYLRIALYNEFTDGADDLDLYLFYCPNNQCVQVAQSGGMTSDEEIDVSLPQAGQYVVLVHGYETDDVTGGPGANYSLFTWSFGISDAVGNFGVQAPTQVSAGDRVNLDVNWASLDRGMHYLGAISHSPNSGTVYGLTIVNVNTP
jgi:subtilisin family serine protease